MSNAEFSTAPTTGDFVPGGSRSPGPLEPIPLVSDLAVPSVSRSPSSQGQPRPDQTVDQTGDPVEIWDVRRGFVAKWRVNGSSAEGGLTGSCIDRVWKRN